MQQLDLQLLPEISCSPSDNNVAVKRAEALAVHVHAQAETCKSAGQRGTVLFAGGAGLVVSVAVPLSLFARLSLAVLTVGNILFWKACMPTTKGRSMHRAK